MDSATSPSAPRRMTGQRHTSKGESFQTRETDQKDICCYVHWFLIDSCVQHWIRADNIVQFGAAHFNELVFPPISHLTLMSFCKKGLLWVAESSVSKSKRKPSPRGEGALQGGWGVGKKKSSLPLAHLPRPSPTVCDGPHVPKGEGCFWDDGFCDFAIRLRAEWQVERHSPKIEDFRT